MNFRALLQQIKENDHVVLVPGLGISGIETGLALDRLGVKAICTDSTSEEKYRQIGKYAARFAALENSTARIEFGVEAGNVGELLERGGLCVLSPGISLQSSFVERIREQNIPISNELEIAVSLLGYPAIYVTGTNGKSTTVTLLDRFLNAAGKNALLCGNVGTPVISKIKPGLLETNPGEDGLLVVEISSYQIESAHDLHPDTGVFLNLSENHLERHGTVENYYRIKSSLFRQMKADDLFVFNADDERVAKLASELSAAKLAISCSAERLSESDSIFIDYRVPDGVDQLRVSGKMSFQLDCSKAPLCGEHNRYNIAAAVAVASRYGVEPDVLQRVLNDFHPLEHRLEAVSINKELVAINDSKSTTPLSTVAALRAVRERYPERGLVLCVGGKLKRGGDLAEEWQGVGDALEQYADELKEVVCFGGDGETLQELLQPFVGEVQYAESLTEMVDQVKPLLKESNLLLFSPGCASFDEFTDFEQRGRVFKELISACA